MNDLTRTPTIDVNGRFTHVHKKSGSVSMPPRPLPSVQLAYRDGVDYSDYISNIWGGSNELFTGEQIELTRAELRSEVDDIIRELESDPEWMPPVFGEGDDSPNEEDSYITLMSDLTIPEYSSGQCLIVSESIALFMKNKHGEDTPPVQGMAEQHEQLNVHYANLFSRDGLPAFVVDFTYSQVDESAEFPVIATPEEWVARIQEDLAKL